MYVWIIGKRAMSINPLRVLGIKYFELNIRIWQQQWQFPKIRKCNDHEVPLAFLLDDQSVYQVSGQLQIVFGHLPSIIRNLSYFCIHAGGASMLHNPSASFIIECSEQSLASRASGGMQLCTMTLTGKDQWVENCLGQLIYNYSQKRILAMFLLFCP